jgi:hypothetical protein
MYINGFILVGTGAGSVIFGTFSYNFINPAHLPPNNGYYDGNLIYLTQSVPACIRYLSLMYILMGITASLLLLPVIRRNRKVE